MFERVAVIGAGAAGLSACWSAAQRGAELVLLDGGIGASCLAGGAVDDRPWEQVARAAEVLGQPPIAGGLPDAVTTFARDLDLWHLSPAGEPLVRLATEAGRVRLARGCDRALLDLSQLPAGARIALPRVSRAEWDADSLGRSLSEDAYAASRGLVFEPIDASVLKLVGEERIAAAELASRHDDARRAGWLLERLREALGRAGHIDAVLFGPWLGADRPLAPRLSAELGLPIGEILGGVGAAAGMRFESARLRLLADIGVELLPKRVTAVVPEGDGVELVLHDGAPITADAVVLAIGGVAAGGIVYSAPELRAGQDVAESGSIPFRLSLELPIELRALGRRLGVTGSMHGPALESSAWPIDADPGLLEAVGVAARDAALPAVYPAGDVLADRPRTLLQAVYSGIAAGAAAAGEPGQLDRRAVG